MLGCARFPMVTCTAEIDESLAMLVAVAGEEGFDMQRLEVGAMIETPVAALTAGRLAWRPIPMATTPTSSADRPGPTAFSPRPCR